MSNSYLVMGRGSVIPWWIRLLLYFKRRQSEQQTFGPTQGDTITVTIYYKKLFGDKYLVRTGMAMKSNPGSDRITFGPAFIFGQWEERDEDK